MVCRSRGVRIAFEKRRSSEITRPNNCVPSVGRYTVSFRRAVLIFIISLSRPARQKLTNDRIKGHSLDDIRDPRSYAELIATGGQLYEALADYYLRVNGWWSAKGKSIPRVLERLDTTVSSKYCERFEALFRHGDPSAVIALAEELLQAHGGLFFDGRRGDAPPQWRKPIA